MIYLISNTNFGYKNNSSEWLEIMTNYFYNTFIPFLKKNVKKGDELIHLGNLFYNQNVNIHILNLVQKLFDDISNIIPIKFLVGVKDKVDKNSINSYLIFNKNNNIKIIEEYSEFENYCMISNCKDFIKYFKLSNKKLFFIHQDFNYNVDDKMIINGYYNDFNTDLNLECIGSPYQLKKEDCDKFRGFCILKLDNKFTKKLFENISSPKFKTLEITNIDELNSLDENFIKNNIVDLNIDKELVKDNETKIKFILSKYNLNNINYIDKEIENEIFIGDKDIIDMIEMKISTYNNEYLLDEFKNIINLSKNKL